MYFFQSQQTCIKLLRKEYRLLKKLITITQDLSHENLLFTYGQKLDGYVRM